MNGLQKGFTLIELMIVVAIIAILAAIAISQYQDYVIRSQVSEGSSLADGVKTAMADYANYRGSFPGSNSSAGLASPGSIVGQFVSKVDVGLVKGVIRVYYGGGSANVQLPVTQILQFSAVTHAGSIEWHCRSDSLPQKWCSSSCRCK